MHATPTITVADTRTHTAVASRAPSRRTDGLGRPVMGANDLGNNNRIGMLRYEQAPTSVLAVLRPNFWEDGNPLEAHV